MGKKRNLTKTGRYFEEKKPLATRFMDRPLPEPTPGRLPFLRLYKTGPTEKVEMSGAELAASFGPSVKSNAIFFLDTSIFSTCTNKPLWNLFLSRQVLITPMVWTELLPWLKNPHKNQDIRKIVLDAVGNQLALINQLALASNRASPPIVQINSVIPEHYRMSVCLDDSHMGKLCREHAYDYYFKLLSLRKIMGPVIAKALERQHNRPPTQDEFTAAVQSQFGERGLQFAQKGKKNIGSANLFSDEQTVVMAILTAILTGCEVYIVTMDTDLPEQFAKLFLLIKEHYRAMLAAELFATQPDKMPLKETSVDNTSPMLNAWVMSSILQLRLPETEFDVLPSTYRSTVVHCILLSSDFEKTPKMSYSCFTIEEDTSRVLRIKAATNGLSTNQFGDRNCTIRTQRLTPDQHEVIVSIGREKTFHFEGWGSFGADDFHNVMTSCEEITRLRPIK
ncbi:MAG TPA: hypothetical protein VG097_19870 [Gemmata sp.]|jgi:hypothetical protein|nr:hypothetical protein [Gemmata sp.]